MDRFYD
jgi:hypothetical protein